MNWLRIITSKNANGIEEGSIDADTSGTIAHFKINGRIWSWTADEDGLLGSAIQSAIDKGQDKARVYLNSGGGNVFAATEISNLLGKFKEVKLEVGAVMASAATYLTSKFYTTIKANTQGMIHKPKLSISGNEDEINSGLRLLKNVQADYIDAYIHKTGKTKEDIEAMWAKGDYWMNAKQLLANGFVDEIQGEIKAFSNVDVLALTACGAPNIPTAKKTNPNYSNKMNEELIALLGLDDKSGNEQIIDAVRKQKLDAIKHRESESQKNRNQKAELTAKAKKVVNDALIAKKITANQVEQYEKLAVADLESTTTILDALTPLPQLSKQFNPSASSGANRADWTMEDYLDKDPEAYETLKLEQPEKAAQLEVDYFGKS